MSIIDNLKSRFTKKEEPDYSFRAYPHLLEIKPKEKYVFHSDFYTVDGSYACVMSFFHTEGAQDNFGPFWGVNRIPGGLGDDITTVTFEQIRRMTDTWVSDHQSQSEGIAEMNLNEQIQSGTHTSRGKASRKGQDLAIIAQELQNGASYLHVHYRLLVKAPTLEKLEEAIKAIERLYIDRFGTLNVATYMGEQKTELSTLFNINQRKIGSGFYFTSTEFAGSYSLVTHGLDDPTGEYIGYMLGDVNNSAVLFDVNKYDHHIVVANESFNESLGRVRVSDMWGSKISQSCLLNDNKVVHLVLNGADLNKLGPEFKNLTYRIDMNNGDVNMFEMFGDKEDELSIFPQQMQKLVLMAEQAYETTDSDRSIIRGSLEEVATQFYIEQRMWRENAGANRDKIRVVGIPHNEVPKLEVFVSYLDTAYKAMVSKTARDDEKLHALSILSVTFKNLLSNNGDLFNTTTTKAIDGAKSGRRVIYDFSKLMRRGKGIAMAQLVNVISYAVGNLGAGDTVIIHGADLIDDTIKNYVTTQLDRLHEDGGRVAYLYNNMDKMISDKSFCEYDKSDYIILGSMTDSAITAYQKELGQDIPPDLARLITTKSSDTCYIRRKYDNVVFKQDLHLGIQQRRVR